MKTTANFSLWTSDDLAYWLNTINLTKYVNNIKSNNINGYDLCYLTNEDFKELGISSIHDKNVLVKNIRMQTLEQLKLVFTYDKRDAVVQLDFDSNFTVYELENYIKEIFQISYNVHISTEEGEMLSPNIKIIELILLNPLKYKRLKIVKGIANIQTQTLLSVNNTSNDNNMNINSNNNNSSGNINSDLNLNNNVGVNAKVSTKYGTILPQQSTTHSELSTIQPQRMNMNVNMNMNTPQPPTNNVIVNQRGLYSNNSKSNIPSIENNSSSSNNNNNTPSTIMNYPTPMYYENRTIDNAISSTGNRDIINDPYRNNNNNDMLLMNGTPKKYLTDKRIYRNSSAIAMKPGNNALDMNYSRKYNMDYGMSTNILNNNNTNNINPSGNNTIIGIKNDSSLNYDYKTQMIPKEFSLNNNNTNTPNPNNNNSTIINTSGYNWKFKKDKKLN